MMKAIRVHEFGGPEVLKYEEIPTPQPEAGQVLVKIRAAGVNPYDTYMRSGTYAIKPPLPYTPGSDAAGLVEAVGAGVTTVKPGDRVYTAKTITGAYAEYTLTLENQVQKLPPNITFDQGAAIWVPYGTAYHALKQEARGRASETVLVHGASGGVGSAAVQIARAESVQRYQGGLHRRNHEGHRRTRRRYRSGDAGKRESVGGSEDARDVWAGDHHRQPRRNHDQPARFDGAARVGAWIHVMGRHRCGSETNPRGLVCR